MKLEQAIASGYPFKHHDSKEWIAPGSSACGFEVTMLQAVSDQWEVKSPPATLYSLVSSGFNLTGSKTSITAFTDQKTFLSYYGVSTMEQLLRSNPYCRVLTFTEDKDPK